MIQSKLLLVVILIVSAPVAGCIEETQPELPSTSPTITSETALPPPESGDTPTATVSRVVDGDTSEVRFEDGEEDTVRLLGVDTPETIASNEDPDRYDGIPDNTDGRDWLLNWGLEAKEYVRGQLDDEQIRVVTDPESDKRGSFGRLLAYIYLDGSNVNQLLLEKGLARVYDSSFSFCEDFYQIEAAAQADDRGVWSFDSGSTVTPTATTQPSTDVVCSEFDSQEEAQEFFERNTPSDDPYRLDADGDGRACESLP